MPQVYIEFSQKMSSLRQLHDEYTILGDNMKAWAMREKLRSTRIEGLARGVPVKLLRTA